MLGQLMDTQAVRAARTALGGLSRRQEAISANVANIDTPGYQRRAVSFETALASTLGRSPAGQLARTNPGHLAAGATGGGGAEAASATRDVVSSRNDSNTVSVDEEMTLLAETQIRYQALTQTLGRRITTLRTAIRG